MCTKTGIKDVYRGIQVAFPQQAMTHARGTAKYHAVGMGLKVIGLNALAVDLDIIYVLGSLKHVLRIYLPACLQAHTLSCIFCSFQSPL